jgi:hypothetical protein
MNIQKRSEVVDVGHPKQRVHSWRTIEPSTSLIEQLFAHQSALRFPIESKLEIHSSTTSTGWELENLGPTQLATVSRRLTRGQC